MKQLKSLIFIAFITLFANSFAFAQQTGSLGGQILDSLGNVVVGATVAAVDAAGKEKNTVTNKQGEFSINSLAPGTYTVRVISPNFSLYENPEVVIAAGRREELTIALTIEAVKEEVEVSNEGQVNTDPNNNAGATVLKEEDLEALPDDPDELEAALQALAGPSAGPNGGQIYIDGFTGGRLPPKEAIREIRINQNPFSAEYERLGFGRIEILTKPGSDKFRGQAFMNFNDESLNSRNPFAVNRASSQTRFFGGSVSGPVQKGKSSYFFDISNRQIDNNAVVNATVLDSSFNPVPFRQEFTVPNRRLSISPRFDYQINDKNTLVARYSFTRFTVDNQGISEFSLPTRAFATTNREHEIRLTETMIINPKTVNETRFEYEDTRRTQQGDNSIPTINVSGAFIGGGAQVGLNFTNEKRWELQNYTTTSLGKNSEHAIKFGARLRGVNLSDRSEANFGGTFTFTGFAAANDPFDLDGDGFVNSIEQYRAKVLGATEARYNPNQFRIVTGNPLADISQIDLGAFITDDWRIRKDLTLSFGLRYENQNNIKDSLNFAPRFSFAYSPGAGGARQPKTVLRGGFGVFYDRFSENFSLQAQRFDGIQQQEYIVSNNAGILGQPVFSLNGVTNVPTAAQLSTVAPLTSTIRNVSDDLQSPYTMQAAIGVERQLPMRTTVSIFYIAARNLHLLRTRNVNAPVCPPLTACPTTAAAVQLLRPDSSQGNIYQYESTGILNQQQLIVNFNSRFSPKFTLFGNYRLGYAKSDSDGAGSFPAYSYDLSNEYGSSALDVRHGLFLGGSFGLPFKFRMSPFVIASTGRPFNITSGIDSNQDSLFNDRPTFTQLSAACARRNLSNSFCHISGVSNPDTTVIPRNYGRGPAFFSVNLNVNRTIGFGASRSATARTTPQNEQTGAPGGGRGGNVLGGGRGDGGRGDGGGRGGMGGGFGGGSDKPYNLTVGLQISNLFNRNNQGTPIGNLSSDRFGQSISTAGGFGGGFGGGGGGGGGNSGNRRVELQMRFNF